MNYTGKRIRKRFLCKTPVFGLLVTALFLVVLSSCDDNEPPPPELPKPTLTDITPNTGTWNEIVVINGTNFGVDATIVDVTFQDSVAVVQRVSDTQMEVIIPEEAGTGPLTITIGENVLTSEVFTYKPFIVSGPQVSTLAGSSQGFADGTGEEAKFSGPHGVAVDADGNVYVADAVNDRIRKITPDGAVTTFAGSGEEGAIDGPAEIATFNNPVDVAVDAFGNVYASDFHGNLIRKISPNGDVITMAGTGIGGFADGPGTTAQFNGPVGIDVDADGNVWVADTENSRIRKITPEGVVSTIAGSSQGFADGTGADAKFNVPHDVTVTSDGILYVADRSNFKIRKITQAGVVTTFAGSDEGYADGTGTAAKFKNARMLNVDADGNLYVSDTDNERIRMITPGGEVSTIAGTGVSGKNDGPGADAQFNNPRGIAVGADGAIYIADRLNQRIRKIIIVE